MKSVRMAVAAGMVVLLAGCGGGGGGSATPATVPTAQTALGCPVGGAAPGGDTSKCEQVAMVGSNPVQVDPTMTAVTVSVSGTLKPASVNSDSIVVWRGAPKTSTVFGGNVSLSADGKAITVALPRRLGLGRTYPVTVDVLDTLGRPVSFIVSLSTSKANCADTAVWSNPGYFSKTLGTCVAYIGVQVKLDQTLNKMQDDTCTLALGNPLSENCADYLSNGTIRLAETQIVVNSELVTWAFTAQDAVLLGTNDPSTTRPNVVAKLASPLPNAIATVTGNVLGGYFVTTDGKGYQASVNAKNEIELVCKLKC